MIILIISTFCKKFLAITESRNTSHLTSLSAEIAALVDEYVSRRLFKEEIDFTESR